jgi:hypothetical protein
MSTKTNILVLACALLPVSGMAFAQTTTSLVVPIGPEASLVSAVTPNFSTSDGTFSSDYLATTTLVFKIRTTKTNGTGNIQLKVTADFGPSGGPSVVSPPTASDTLSYTVGASPHGTPATGSTTADALNTLYPVYTFGGGASSAKVGDTGTVLWDLSNDPMYGTGSYTATVTFTMSAT